MRVSVSALKQRRLLPLIAVAVSFLFLTGQVLNCCLINESIASAIKCGLHAGTHSVAKQEAKTGDRHAHCHGHSDENASPSNANLSAGVPGDCQLSNDASCLSEHSFAGKPMAASEYAAPGIVIAVLYWLPELPAAPSFLTLNPRPQNKSSPPLYLTTLRLLV